MYVFNGFRSYYITFKAVRKSQMEKLAKLVAQMSWKSKKGSFKSTGYLELNTHFLCYY